MPERVLVGGAERRPIEIVEHDPTWAARYAALRPPLVEALAGVAVRVEHVGSTAVPGLAAKPIVGVQVWLRRASDDRERYERVKRRLASREWEDMNAYADAKSAVIREIAARADAWAAASGWSLPAV